MSEVSQEVVERAFALIRRMSSEPEWLQVFAMVDEARAIVALLPEQVDPDLLEARELFLAIEGGVDADADTVRDVRNGAADVSDEVRLLLAGIKRGRTLQIKQQ